MTGTDFIGAAARKLAALWPERPVHTGTFPTETAGSFFIRCTGQSCGKKLGRRRSRSYQFEILCFPAEGESLDFCGWAEAMCQSFEELEPEEGTFHLSGIRAEDGGDGVWHFFFGAVFTCLLPPPGWERMEALEQAAEVKENEQRENVRAPL